MATPNINASAFRPGAAIEVAIGAASAQSAALSASATLIRVIATSSCRIAIGADPTALATSLYLPANGPEYFIVSAADKVAVIRETADGKLSITELSS